MAETPNRPPLTGVIRRWVSDSVRTRGVLGTARFFMESLWEVLRDCTPERRRSRFGDIDYDCDYGVDTTWARLGWGVRLREVFSERLYQPTPPEEFGEIMQQLATVDFTSYTFIDMGSGKGRVLLMAAMYPFREVIGVEVQPQLHEVALHNLENFHLEGRQCCSVHSVCADARDFAFPSGPLVVYLFNPFPDYVLRRVLENLGESLHREPRACHVVYNAPFEQQVFAEFGWLEKTVEDSRYQLYRPRI